jgi:ABC-type transport system involved in multi-copper enzyme maturation permease subunit
VILVVRRMHSEPASITKLDVWTKLFHIASRIVLFGILLGAVAHLLLGREFRNDELGFLLWPLTVLYLLSFFYVLTFLVFTSVKSGLRYVVIPLWILMMVLILGAMLSLVFSKRGEIVEPNAAPNGGPAASVEKSNAPGGPPSVS